MINEMKRSLGLALGLAMVFSMLGCAFGEIYWTDPLKREHSLGEAQKRYTELVRFGKFTQASAFVDPVMTEEFVESFPPRKKFVFTDYETGPIEFDEESGRENATVRVEYTGYFSNAMIILDFVEEQHWYRNTLLNDWLVRSTFENFERVTE